MVVSFSTKIPAFVIIGQRHSLLWQLFLLSQFSQIIWIGSLRGEDFYCFSQSGTRIAHRCQFSVRSKENDELLYLTNIIPAKLGFRED
jgi:hypothetical protein